MPFSSGKLPAAEPTYAQRCAARAVEMRLGDLISTIRSSGLTAEPIIADIKRAVEAAISLILAAK